VKEFCVITSVSHIALFVPDLQEAEEPYQNVFDMVLDMGSLRKGEFVLALFQGTNHVGQVYAIG
jgi:catechol 2,3-dioxygenase-like lactoylglutathione lyase family enzyme